MEQVLPKSSCYCLPVVPDLLAGEYPGAADRAGAVAKLHSFREAGVTFFLDLTEEGELEPYAGLFAEVWPADAPPPVHRRMPIRDLGVPSHPSVLRSILDTIDAALAEGHRVYVHCWGGVGRTGTVIGAWLVRRGLDGAAALEEVQRLFDASPKGIATPRPSPETRAQCDYVRTWTETEAR